jgi:hypothetical protein
MQKTRPDPHVLPQVGTLSVGLRTNHTARGKHTRVGASGPAGTSGYSYNYLNTRNYATLCCTITLRMRSARRASVRSAGCEALCAEQSADSPHPPRCRGAKRPRQQKDQPRVQRVGYIALLGKLSCLITPVAVNESPMFLSQSLMNSSICRHR